MKNKISLKSILSFLGIALGISLVLIVTSQLFLRVTASEKTQTVAVRTINTVIQADGAITAQNQANLHFQTAGNLVYLPFKEGDSVKQGQIIASLDTTTLQKQLTQALNTYQSTRDAFDQTQTNSTNNILQGQQKVIANAAGVSADNSSSIINDAAKRILDENQQSLNNSVLNVEIAQQALQLATLTSPIDGIVTHMDVTTSGVNVTTTTSFVVTDPSSLVFRANVLENDIDYVATGSTATIKFGNNQNAITGTVIKIYPDKIVLPTGGNAYQVDIQSTVLPSTAKLGQEGTAMIQSNIQNAVKLVPTWMVFSHGSIWVITNGKPVLRNITVGKTHGGMTEVLTGLEENDELITNPEYIVSQRYQVF